MASPPNSFSFVSDRDKGLLGSINGVFPGTYHRWCAVHLRCYTVERYAGAAGKAFMNLEYARTPFVWEQIYAKLSQGKPQAALYLAPEGSKPSETYSNAYFQGSSFGYVSSNFGMVF